MGPWKLIDQLFFDFLVVFFTINKDTGMITVPKVMLSYRILFFVHTRSTAWFKEIWKDVKFESKLLQSSRNPCFPMVSVRFRGGLENVYTSRSWFPRAWLMVVKNCWDLGPFLCRWIFSTTGVNGYLDGYGKHDTKIGWDISLFFHLV